MSWRTVVISGRCKLDLKMGYLVVRSDVTRRIFLDEIAVLLIENTAVSITCCLLEELIQKKIKVIFCDNKRNPLSELCPLYGSHDCSQKLKLQINWDNEIKGLVWTEIVSEKIKNQHHLLLELEKNSEAKLLKEYIEEITFNDVSNREGHAAKVYFNAVFGMDFSRGDASNPINSALNYGYGILLSAVNREVVSNGYLTQLGLFHDNMFNQFNLSCDLMEPFRIYIDRFVAHTKYTEFESDQKHELLMLFNQNVFIGDSYQTLFNAIKIYVKSVFNAINDKDISQIKFTRREV